MAPARKQFRLLDVATISGSTIQEFKGQKQYVATGDINVNRIVVGTTVTYANRPSRANLKMGGGEVLFAKMRGTVKVLAGSPEVEDMIFSTGFYILNPSKQVLKDYLYFYLLSDDFNRQKDLYSSGATMAGIGNAGLKRITISLPIDKNGDPDLKEQERIVTLLHEAEELKAKRTLASQKMVEVVSALFVKMFGNGSKWSAKKLGEVCEFRNGKAHEPFIASDGKYIVINSKFIASDGAVKKFSNENLSPLTAGDLTIVMSDIPNGKALAKCFLVDQDDKYALNQRIGLIRSDQVNPIFLLHQLNRNRYFLSFNNGQSQTNLRKDEVLGCPVFVPPHALQMEFAERVKALASVADKQRESTTKIESLFTSLMSQSFTQSA
jgi:type I restriction enzyme, S subunit